jgi:pimeloyl-ACP methyl ester carboxylesterase
MNKVHYKTKRLPIQSFTRKARRIMLTIVSILLTGIFILVGVLLVLSPGKPKPFLNENGNPLPGSISEKIHININGVEQGMFIKGKNINNPVLLYLHGGMPDYFLTQNYPVNLEDHFTVVWWEQRGSGISYGDDISKDSITAEQLISDTLVLTDYLRNRFHKEKIYLMGHSGGTFFGIQVASQHPELYYAYIGEAQYSHQIESEKLAYDYMLQEFKATGNTKMVKKLEAAPVTMQSGTPAEYLAIRDVAMHELGIGTTRDMKSIVTGIFLPSLTFQEYTFMEKLNMWRGKARNGVSVMWDASLYVDLGQQATEFDLPVYFLEGVYDYTCNYSLAKEYFGKIEAPIKGFYTFEKSAHSPMFEEPEKMRQILLEDVLTGSNNLADVK